MDNEIAKVWFVPIVWISMFSQFEIKLNHMRIQLNYNWIIFYVMMTKYLYESHNTH